MKKFMTVLLLCWSTSVFGQAQPTLDLVKAKGDGLYAVLVTDQGDIVLQLEYKAAPLTVSNFVGLAEGTFNLMRPGKPFYNGLTFHRVIPDFMSQGGDPNGNGTGGPGYYFADEISPDFHFDVPGVAAMANSGPDTNGSQFFLTHKAATWLEGKYSIFGHVIAGQDVNLKLINGSLLQKVVIVRQGKAAQAFKPDLDSFSELMKAQKEKNQSQKAAREKAVFDDLMKKTTVTASGLRYLVTKTGSGSKPFTGQTVSAQYEGRLLSGTVFDSSYKRGQPFQFTVGKGQVIQGWDEAFLDMKPGEKRTLLIPPELAYGSRGAGAMIPPDSWLVFDVELVSIVN